MRGSGRLRRAGADACLGRAPSVSIAGRLTLAFGSNWGAASNVVREDRCSCWRAEGEVGRDARFATSEARTELREWVGAHCRFPRGYRSNAPGG